MGKARKKRNDCFCRQQRSKQLLKAASAFAVAAQYIHDNNSRTRNSSKLKDPLLPRPLRHVPGGYFPRITVSGRGMIFPAMFLRWSEPCCHCSSRWHKAALADVTYPWRGHAARTSASLLREELLPAALPVSAPPRLSEPTSCRLQEGCFFFPPSRKPHLKLPCHRDWLKPRFSHPPAAPSCLLSSATAGLRRPAQGTAPAKHSPQPSSLPKVCFSPQPLAREGWGRTAECSPLSRRSTDSHYINRLVKPHPKPPRECRKQRLLLCLCRAPLTSTSKYISLLPPAKGAAGGNRGTFHISISNRGASAGISSLSPQHLKAPAIPKQTVSTPAEPRAGFRPLIK